MKLNPKGSRESRVQESDMQSQEVKESRSPGAPDFSTLDPRLLFDSQLLNPLGPQKLE